jgi:hypothetical protein
VDLRRRAGRDAEARHVRRLVLGPVEQEAARVVRRAVGRRGRVGLRHRQRDVDARQARGGDVRGDVGGGVALGRAGLRPRDDRGDLLGLEREIVLERRAAVRGGPGRHRARARSERHRVRVRRGGGVVVERHGPDAALGVARGAARLDDGADVLVPRRRVDERRERGVGLADRVLGVGAGEEEGEHGGGPVGRVQTPARGGSATPPRAARRRRLRAGTPPRRARRGRAPAPRRP